jgi:hypothetical protein
MLGARLPIGQSLNIIEAAEQVFAGHQVREISYAMATNLTGTVDAVVRSIQVAQRDQKYLACFVTGVPGAGKTLAGLSAVHDPALRVDRQARRGVSVWKWSACEYRQSSIATRS